MNRIASFRMASLRIVGAAALMMATGAVVASAQPQKVTSKIPFAFSVSGGPKMAPGAYEMVQMTGAVRAGGWTVRNAATGAAAMVMTSSATRPADVASSMKATLVFRCAGSDCALAELYLPGRSTGYAMAVPRIRAPETGVRVAASRRIVVAD